MIVDDGEVQCARGWGWPVQCSAASDREWGRQTPDWGQTAAAQTCSRTTDTDPPWSSNFAQYGTIQKTCKWKENI